jgi:hypothetical protein
MVNVCTFGRICTNQGLGCGFSLVKGQRTSQTFEGMSATKSTWGLLRCRSNLCYINESVSSVSWPVIRPTLPCDSPTTSTLIVSDASLLSLDAYSLSLLERLLWLIRYQTSLRRLKRWMVVYQLDHACIHHVAAAPSFPSSNSMIQVSIINSYDIFGYFTGSSRDIRNYGCYDK